MSTGSFFCFLKLAQGLDLPVVIFGISPLDCLLVVLVSLSVVINWLLPLDRCLLVVLFFTTDSELFYFAFG